MYVTNHEKQRDNEIFLSSPDGEIRTYLLPSTNDANQIHPPSIPNTPLGTQTPRMQQTPTTGLGIIENEGRVTYRSVYTYTGLFAGRILSNVGIRVHSILYYQVFIIIVSGSIVIYRMGFSNDYALQDLYM